MSTICLAAHRSYTTGDAVYFTWRVPGLRKCCAGAFYWLTGACLLVAAGLYAHLYWQYRHPPTPAPARKVADAPTRLSPMHYVLVTKPFPDRQATPEPDAAPPPDTMPHDILPDDSAEDNDWTHTPDGALATHTLPPAADQSLSLKERLLKALQEQQREYPPSAQSDSATSPEEMPAGEQDGTGKSPYPPLSSQLQSVQRQVPALNYQSHLYSSDAPLSKVVINGKTYHCGDKLTPEVTIYDIQPQTLTLSLSGHYYTLPALKNWQPPVS
ncbi:general secretion pathway protein GspB [Entomohabitans teleogrylli]|uniref:general secretion pathway protein GspB n=1 Tax=Entomohabitans teleogrylli TaxID=1384589 RepID=UPI0008FCD11B|nr:general secretion pathway protein GspB [Entomohabitans teleogrylli]